MADELQGLLDRISQEGLEKAEAQKDEILKKARDEAKRIIDEAKSTADKTIHDAESEAAKLQASGEAGLQQASRDVIISLETRIKECLSTLVKASLGEAMSAERLAEIVGALAKNYAERGGTGNLQVLASDEQLNELQTAFQAKLAEQFKGGIEIQPVPGIEAGVKVSFSNDAVVFDVTSDAVSEMLCAYLNPRVLQILRGSKG